MGNTLGLSFGHHDSAAVVSDSSGKILFASLEERFSRKKHDSRFPGLTIFHILENYDIDNVSIFDKDLGFWKRRENKTKILNYLASRVPVTSYNHHDTHAMSAIGMNFKKPGAVMVIDTQGAKKATSLGYWDGSKLTWLKTFDYPNSIGLFYSAVTKFCGLKPLNDENIVMSAADKGKPIYTKAMENFILKPEKGSYRLLADEKMLNSLANKGIGKVDFNICASAQEVLEKCVSTLAIWLKEETGSDTLYYAGGVAYNCVMNTKLYKWYKKVFINPAAGDAGCAMGAVWMDKKIPCFPNPYLGYNEPYTDSQIEEWMLQIKNGGIAMVLGDRAEWGPRALGHRSLLCRPTKDNIKKLNYIKERTTDNWRPYAPIGFREGIAKNYSLGNVDSRYMLNVVPSKFANNPIYPTGRVQTVEENTDHLIGKLLDFYFQGDDNLEPYLINTSLNRKGMPMPNSLKDLDLNWYSNIKEFINI